MTRGESSGPDRHAQGAPRPQAKAHVPGGTEWSQHGKQLGPQIREQQGIPLLPQPPASSLALSAQSHHDPARGPRCSQLSCAGPRSLGCHPRSLPGPCFSYIPFWGKDGCGSLCPAGWPLHQKQHDPACPGQGPSSLTLPASALSAPHGVGAALNIEATINRK